jgi:hypothetical protein
MLRSFGLGLEEPNGSLVPERAMGSLHSPSGRRAGRIDAPARSVHVSCLEVDALREENKQLRELVVQLSEIVVRSVLDGK